MSRTIRRTQFNKKKHFFQHYWEAFSQAEVKDNTYIEVWQYHSDNYYTKSCKNLKQFIKNLEYRTLRREFKEKILKTSQLEDFFLKKTKAESIRRKLH